MKDWCSKPQCSVLQSALNYLLGFRQNMYNVLLMKVTASQCMLASVIYSLPTCSRPNSIHLYFHQLKPNWQLCRCNSHMILANIFSCDIQDAVSQNMTRELPRLKLHVSSWMQAALSSGAQSRVLQKPLDKNGIPYQPALINCAHDCQKYICNRIFCWSKLCCSCTYTEIHVCTFWCNNSIRTCISLKRQWPTSFEAAVVICLYNVVKSIFSCRILRKMITTVKWWR